MAKRTPSQIYADLRTAGASDDAARILTEISGAESGFDDAAIGDVKLENQTWGPSFGLFQIRTVKGDTGKGSPRDIANLTGNDAAQAAAALQISNGGTDFTPWSTYTSGAYLKQAVNVDAELGAPAAASGSSTTALAGLPIPGLSTALSGVRGIVIEAGFAILGVALIGLGVAHLASPAVHKVTDAADAAGADAAKAALLA